MRPRIVGLTGRTGCGKSTVSALLRSWGAVVCDADAVARTVVQPGSPCLAQLCAAFGQDILDETGALRRKLLAQRAFADAAGAARLSAITHPAILRSILACADEAGRQGANLFFVDGAVIVGHSLQPYCWRIAVVDAPDEMILARICARDGISMQMAHQRLAAQTPREALRAAADYWIENSADQAALAQKAALFYKAVMEDADAAKTTR